MTGLDEALNRNSWIDSNRLRVTAAAIGLLDIPIDSRRLRSVVNFISDDGTRDDAYGHEEDFKGFLFDFFHQHWEASPLKYAANLKTPMLMLDSDNDLRVPLE